MHDAEEKIKIITKIYLTLRHNNNNPTQCSSSCFFIIFKNSIFIIFLLLFLFIHKFFFIMNLYVFLCEHNKNKRVCWKRKFLWSDLTVRLVCEYRKKIKKKLKLRKREKIFYIQIYRRSLDCKRIKTAYSRRSTGGRFFSIFPIFFLSKINKFLYFLSQKMFTHIFLFLIVSCFIIYSWYGK